MVPLPPPSCQDSGGTAAVINSLTESIGSLNASGAPSIGWRFWIGSAKKSEISCVITEIDSRPLLSKNGRPSRDFASDHLPIILGLEL